MAQRNGGTTRRTVLTGAMAVLASAATTARRAFAVEEGYRMWDGDMRDASRNRTIPYRVYAPEPLDGVYPVIIVSHGVGGSREAMPYLGRYLAENGYVALHIQHPGTDESVWRGMTELDDIYNALRQAMWSSRGALDRFQDVPFVVDQLAVWNSSGPLAGHLDLDRIGMAGHSYGSVSTMVAAGQRMGPGGQWFFKEPRIKAGLVMSPSTPIQGGDLAPLYRDIDIPLFHVTGTEDGPPMPTNQPFQPARRTVPYQALTIPDQYLLVLDGADHNAFSGLAYGPHAHGPEVETRYTKAVENGALLFFDAYVKGDPAAKVALQSAFPLSLTPGDRFDYK